MTDPVNESAANYQQFVEALGPKYLNSPNNREAILAVVDPILERREVVTVVDFTHVWLALTAEGKLEEPLSEAQLKLQAEERTRERNRRLEAKDRQSGGVYVDENGNIHRSHLTDAEREELQAKAESEARAEAKQIFQRIRERAQKGDEVASLEPTPNDAFNSLNAILAGVTVSTATKETKLAVNQWYKQTSSKNILHVKRSYPTIAQKADLILLKDFSQADL